MLISIFLSLGLTACGQGISLSRETSSIFLPTTKVGDVDEKHSPMFMDLEKGKAGLKSLTHATSSWTLLSRKNFLFASYGQYVFRYDISKNIIDKTIDLGEQLTGWSFGISISSNGRYLVSYSFEFPSTEPERNFFLIDFESETAKLICDNYVNKTEADNIANSMIPNEVKGEFENLRFKTPSPDHSCRITEELSPGSIQYYFHNQNGDAKEISPFSNFALGLGGYSIISQNQIGAIIPIGDEFHGRIAYYKIVVIDVNEDKIIQEYALNSN